MTWFLAATAAAAAAVTSVVSDCPYSKRNTLFHLTFHTNIIKVGKNQGEQQDNKFTWTSVTLRKKLSLHQFSLECFS